MNSNKPFNVLIPEQIRINGFETLSITMEHITKMTNLPFHHRDPFDRLLIAQSLYEEMPIISCDNAFDAYSADRIWD